MMDETPATNDTTQAAQPPLPAQPESAWLADIERADRAKDHTALRQARQGLVSQHPQTDSAAEAYYKLGLDQLFTARNIILAVDYFEAAVKCRHAFWSPAARTSLGLCLLQQKRHQKALFELRKVGYVKDPSMHSVLALAFIEAVLLTDGQADEAQRVRKDRIAQLEQLSASYRANQGKGSELAVLLGQLSQAYGDAGQKERAQATMAEARAAGSSGQVLGMESEVLNLLQHQG